MTYGEKKTSILRWGYLLMGTVILIFGGMIYGWSLFSTYFADCFPTWTPDALAMTFTISMCSFCAGGFLAGHFARMITPRVVLIAAAILSFLGFFGISQMPSTNPAASLWTLYFCYGVLASGGVGVCFNTVLATVSKWFPDRSGFATGTMMMGFGCGALILGSISIQWIERYGVFQAFLLLGTCTAAVILAGAVIIQEPAQTKKAIIDTTPQKNIVESTEVRTRDMLLDSSFWLFFLWAVTMNIAGIMVIGNAAMIAMSAGMPALMGMVVSICNGMGRIMIGALFDIVGRERTMLTNMCMLFFAGSILLISVKTGSGILLLIGLMLMGIEYGGNPIICSVYARSQYGEKNYATNFGLINFSIIPAALIGPKLANMLTKMTDGTFLGVFSAIMICSVTACMIFVVLNKTCSSRS